MVCVSKALILEQTIQFKSTNIYWTLGGVRERQKGTRLASVSVLPNVKAVRPSIKGHGYPLQQSCLENPMDSPLVGYSSGTAKSRTILNDKHFHL